MSFEGHDLAEVIIARTSAHAQDAPRQPRYRQIAEELRRSILDGTYRAGVRLPTELELAHRHGVSRVTSAAALGVLARDGLVERAPRRGTIVKPGAHVARTPGRTLVAWIQHGLDAAFHLELLRGVEAGARRSDFDLLFALSEGSARDEVQAIRNALAAGAQGLLLVLQDGETYNAEVLRLVLDGFPLVLVDREIHGLRCSTVSSDNEGGARLLLEQLLAAGHHAICALTFPPVGTSTIADRMRGYVQALTAAGIPVDYSLHYTVAGMEAVLSGWQVREPTIEQFAAFLQARPHITAIFAINTPLALLALCTLKRLRLRVPEDMSVVCFDPLQAIPASVRPLTAAIQQSGEIGRTAVALLREALAGTALRGVRLPVRLQHAGSIGPPAVRRQSLASP